MYEKITSENVMMFAIRHYNNPQCEGEKEFQDDLKRFKYIKRLLRKYYETGILKERLLLNHFILSTNPEKLICLTKGQKSTKVFLIKLWHMSTK